MLLANKKLYYLNPTLHEEYSVINSLMEDLLRRKDYY